MPILSTIRPGIPANSKDHFLAAWPTLLGELQAQPGLLHATAGQVVAEDGQRVDEFKIIQLLAFANVEDEETFTKSPWAQEHKARLESSGAPEPTFGRFKFSEFSANPSPKPFLQLTSITLPSESQREEASKAWAELVTILGKETRGGVLLRDDVFNGLALIGWDSLEEVENAYKEPKAAEALAAYKRLGQVRSALVKLL
ncbi:hypothetical protein FOQG_14859 [Fusarium oxysporum f. sp. raphani 54005]|uniref:ABM domain-containing protein n=2 Tax=Fusarium oxysporum f. sp. raphani TaxID=96318 RepID=X0BP21_FUSOX|nr:hypothetical protein FOQG_14859 [Fusarium oxysporum f. sp. raphani 54005]KAG7437194.1 hypothetical protein Forpi1262_v001984 [Fusarium oxysporum f. sp. raphani]